jgi:soluble lytic murein transglycosylase
MSFANTLSGSFSGKLSRAAALALACCASVAHLAVAADDPTRPETAALLSAPAAPQAEPRPLPFADSKVDGAVIVEARDAQRRGDRRRLAALRDAAVSTQHPLAMWTDYWELGSRLTSASTTEVNAFYARWRGSYVEDRLRNDWLLVVGRRRDWETFARDVAQYRMNDDREVACYALLTEHLAGRDVGEPGRAAWYAQRDADDGCHVLAATLARDKVLSSADVWRKVRLSIELNRPKAAKQAAALIDTAAAQAVAALVDSPAKYLTVDMPKPRPKRKGGGPRATPQAPVRNLLQSPELLALAVMRMATNDPSAAVRELQRPWAVALAPELAASAWAAVAREAALSLQPEAFGYFTQAFATRQKIASRADRLDAPQTPEPALWSDETNAWAVRAALRSSAPEGARWALAAKAIDAMSPNEQNEPVWIYWKARATQALAEAGPAGDPARLASRQSLATIVSPLHFYGKLANEDLGGRLILPAAPAALTGQERAAAESNPGLTRALQMMAIGLRGEGVREWNFSLRGMSDRELLAAAQVACDREIWDRCINTSDRTRVEVDMAQRFPTPFRAEVVEASRQIGLDPAYVYGLIRQESRFIMNAQSGVGASGLMQVMPATAKWTARKIGLPFTPEMISDRAVNIKIGTSYLKLVLDSFDGSAALATAAYNAGPSRSRRWREGVSMEVAAWAESIPFNETRDYVKKVLSNATLYAALLDSAPGSGLTARMGASIGPAAPRELASARIDKDLP